MYMCENRKTVKTKRSKQTMHSVNTYADTPTYIDVVRVS